MNVLITGVSGLLGQAVTRRLIVDNPFGRVFGLDLQSPRLLGPVRFVQGDITRVDIADLLVLHDVEVVIHLVFGNAARARKGVAATHKVVEAARLAEVRRVVMVSGYEVYSTYDPMMLAPRVESDPLWRPHDAPSHLKRRVQAEHILRKAAEGCPDMEAVALRFCQVIGPGTRTEVDDLLAAPWLLGARGRDPLIQFLHVEDAAEALIRASTRPGLDGAINVAGPEPIPMSVVAGILERPMLKPPAAMALPVLALMRRLKLVRFGPVQWMRLQSSVPLEVERMVQTLGCRPRYSTRQTLALWRTHHRAQGGEAHTSAYGRDLIQ